MTPAQTPPPPSPPATWKTRLRRYRVIIGCMFACGFALLGLAVWDKYSEVSFTNMVRELGSQGVHVRRHVVPADWVRTSAWGRRVPEFFASMFDRKSASATFRGRDFTIEAVRRVAELGNLEHAHFVDTACMDEAAMTLLGQCRSLKSLSIQDALLTDASLYPLERLSSLQGMFIDAPNVTDQGLNVLRGLKVAHVGVQINPEKVRALRDITLDVSGPGRRELAAGDIPTIHVTFRAAESLGAKMSVHVRLSRKEDRAGIYALGPVTGLKEGFYEFRGPTTSALEGAGEYEAYIAVIIPGTPQIVLSVTRPAFTLNPASTHPGASR